MNCANTCPKGLNPAQAIGQIKQIENILRPDVVAASARYGIKSGMRRCVHPKFGRIISYYQLYPENF
jgi:hypothetical protein